MTVTNVVALPKAPYRPERITLDRAEIVGSLMDLTAMAMDALDQLGTGLQLARQAALDSGAAADWELVRALTDAAATLLRLRDSLRNESAALDGYTDS